MAGWTWVEALARYTSMAKKSGCSRGGGIGSSGSTASECDLESFRNGLHSRL